MKSFICVIAYIDIEINYDLTNNETTGIIVMLQKLKLHSNNKVDIISNNVNDIVHNKGRM